ncbi:MAG: hypothetical protein COB15_05115 [Flavobacteriales bacterium]|nr:MAG: hypothetical protein COB15_05115 [Flavobacteriales bacterium]
MERNEKQLAKLGMPRAKEISEHLAFGLDFWFFLFKKKNLFDFFLIGKNNYSPYYKGFWIETAFKDSVCGLKRNLSKIGKC